MLPLREYLVGEWRFKRRVTREGKDYARGNGTAGFTQQDETATLLYAETGRMISVDRPDYFDFYQRFLYKFDHSSLYVIFNEGPQAGETYQAYSLLNGIPHQQHICGKDCYNSLYSILNKNNFVIETAINGPQKNEMIKTLFKRKTVTH